MLTVRNAEQDKVAALDAGADDYITKPFSMPELLARMRASLRRLPLSPQDAAIPIVFDGIEINVAAHRVTVRGKDVRFTPKEFDLLRYFATNPDVIVPYGAAASHSGPGLRGDQVEYLHVFINQIRKKIEPDPSRPRYLLTEPRLGYRFCLTPAASEA